MEAKTEPHAQHLTTRVILYSLSPSRKPDGTVNNSSFCKRNLNTKFASSSSIAFLPCMQFLNSRAQIIIIIIDSGSSGALSCRLTTIFLALVVLLLVAIVLRLEDK